MPYIITDLDGVLGHCWFPGDYEFRPKLRLKAHAILTNQGGVVLRLCYRWARKYPGLRQTLKRIRAGMKYSGARRVLAVCYHPKQEKHWLGKILALLGRLCPVIPVPVPEGMIFLSLSPRFRKPSPDGLLWLARGKQDVIFYGDEESDRVTALRAGARFVHVPSERSGASA
jgi:hypothetical protein